MAAVAELGSLGIITRTQKYETTQNDKVGRLGHGIDWAGDNDCPKFSRVVFVEESSGGVFFRQVVVGLVSVIHRLADIYHYRRRQFLLEEARRYES